MKKILSKLSLVALIATMGLISACSNPGTGSSTPDGSTTCEHSGGSATCTTAAVCEKCGESYGEANGHTWADATCTDPKTCTVEGCGATEGEANGHTWADATCTDPKTCTVEGCGAKEGTAGHKYDADGHCSVCNGDIIVSNPVANKPYIFGMYQGNKNDVYYLKGGMSGYYMATTTNPAEAIFVYVEETTGGYYAYCYVNGAKTYINMVVSGTHVNGAYEAKASTVYTIDEEHHTLIAKVNGTDYWFATRNDNTYTTMGPCKVSFQGFYGEFYDAHTHAYTKDGATVSATCTEDGYTEKLCECGEIEKTNVVTALGHQAGDWTEKTPATCTEDGEKVKICTRENCGATVETEVITALGHTYVDGTCGCGAQDPNYEAHVHNYAEEVTAPTCTAAGFTTFTCPCGDTYTGNETEMLPHIDTNLDITCDYEGCTTRILPEGDTKISLFTANHMIIISLTKSYYMEGVITEITDAKNGVFIIEDEAGDSILIRLPKNADNVSYSGWTDKKVVVGDTVQIYGKPSRNSSTPTTEAAKVESGVLTILKHEHNFSEATCTDAAVCGCLAVGDAALGHSNENGDNLCDRCEWNLNWKISNIVIATDPALANGVQTQGSDGKAIAWTWSDDNFDAVIAKGTSTVTLYTTAKAYMQLKKQNTFTLTNKNDKSIKTITLSVTTTTYLTNLETVLKNAGLTVTKDEAALTITIEWNSTEDFTFSNTSASTIYISGAEIIYE